MVDISNILIIYIYTYLIEKNFPHTCCIVSISYDDTIIWFFDIYEIIFKDYLIYLII